MDKTTQERIKADAEAYANGVGDVYRKYASLYGYITGATAVEERAQVLVDALEAIAANCEHPGIKSFATKALEQWKGEGKEVGNE